MGLSSGSGDRVRPLRPPRPASNQPADPLPKRRLTPLISAPPPAPPDSPNTRRRLMRPVTPKSAARCPFLPVPYSTLPTGSH